MRPYYLVFLLAGCTPPSTIIKEPVEVLVPVAKACPVEYPEKPFWALDEPGLKEANVFNKVNAALKEIEQRRGYERELEAALGVCKTLPK